MEKVAVMFTAITWFLISKADYALAPRTMWLARPLAVGAGLLLAGMMVIDLKTAYWFLTA
jgi:hypothetical protein